MIGSANTTVVMDKNKTVRAVFVKEDDPAPTLCTLTIEIEEQGEVYEAGTVVTLRAIPEERWQFKEWRGEVQDSGSLSTEVIMDDHKRVIAVFERKEPVKCTLTIEIEGEGSACSATPESGAEFKANTRANTKVGFIEMQRIEKCMLLSIHQYKTFINCLLWELSLYTSFTLGSLVYCDLPWMG